VRRAEQVEEPVDVFQAMILSEKSAHGLPQRTRQGSKPCAVRRVLRQTPIEIRSPIRSPDHLAFCKRWLDSNVEKVSVVDFAANA
jgi:hypothetical protein